MKKKAGSHVWSPSPTNICIRYFYRYFFGVLYNVFCLLILWIIILIAPIIELNFCQIPLILWYHAIRAGSRIFLPGGFIDFRRGANCAAAFQPMWKYFLGYFLWGCWFFMGVLSIFQGCAEKCSRGCKTPCTPLPGSNPVCNIY